MLQLPLAKILKIQHNIAHMESVWKRLPRPIKILAPMEDVTDTVFRRIVASYGRPDLFFTEFTSADGLFSPGRDEVIRRLQFTQEERPIIAQIWGNKPENYRKAAIFCRDLGFDGMDINMGCPVPKIVKMGACSALMNDRVLASELVLAAKDGAGSMPVSVKTRLGFRRTETEEWAGFLLSLNPAALTIHGRTAVQQSKGAANWDEIGKVVQLRNSMSAETVIIGNGDIKNLYDLLQKYELYGVDGAMVGRGIFEDLSFFNPGKGEWRDSPARRLSALAKHLRLFYETWGDKRSYGIMKKFFKLYVNGFAGAAQLRVKLMETENIYEALEFLSPYLFSAPDGQEALSNMAPGV